MISTKIKIKDLLEVIRINKPNALKEEEVTDHYRRFMRIHGINRPRDLYVYPISKDRLTIANMHFLNIVKALYKFAQVTLFGNTSWLRKMDLEGIDIDAVQARGNAYLFQYARIDSIYDGDQFRVLEVNTKRPQIYEEIDWMGNFLEEKTRGVVEYQSVTDSIVQSFSSAIEIYQKDVPEMIVVVSDFVKYLEREGILSGLVMSLKRYFPKTFIEILGCKGVNDLMKNHTLRSNEIIYKGKKLGGIVIKDICNLNSSFVDRYGNIRNEDMALAYRLKKIEISTPPVSRLIGSKVALAMIQEKDIQKLLGLSEDEKESIGLILANRLVNKSSKISKKDNYVIKIANIGGGKGVYMGTELSWSKLAELRSKFQEKDDKIILQEKADYGIDNIIDLQDYRYKDALTTLDPFIVNDPNQEIPIKVVGYASRAIKITEAPKEPRFNPDAERSEIMFGGVVVCGS